MSSSAPLRISTFMITFWAVLFPRSVFHSFHCSLCHGFGWWPETVVWRLFLFSVSPFPNFFTRSFIYRYPKLISHLSYFTPLIIITFYLCSRLLGYKDTKGILILKKEKYPPFNKQLLSLVPTAQPFIPHVVSSFHLLAFCGLEGNTQNSGDLVVWSTPSSSASSFDSLFFNSSCDCAECPFCQEPVPSFGFRSFLLAQELSSTVNSSFFIFHKNSHIANYS